jgi:glutathione S-transferase
MKLITNQPSPYGRKVMVALLEKQLPFELVQDVPWVKQTIVPRYNPLEQLPILITDDGESIYESSFILEWLERKFPNPPLLPRDLDPFLQARKVQVLAEGVLEAWGRLTLEQIREHPMQGWMKRQTRKIDGGLAELNRLIGDREYAVGNSLTVGDIAIVALLGMLDFAQQHRTGKGNEWRTDHANLGRYFDALEQRPSFRESRPRLLNVNVSELLS